MSRQPLPKAEAELARPSPGRDTIALWALAWSGIPLVFGIHPLYAGLVAIGLFLLHRIPNHLTARIDRLLALEYSWGSITKFAVGAAFAYVGIWVWIDRMRGRTTSLDEALGNWLTGLFLVLLFGCLALWERRRERHETSGELNGPP